MAMREHEQIEQLEAYWTDLERDPAAAPPAGLDADLAQTAQRLVSRLRPPEPGTAFVAQLGRQLKAQAAEMSRPANPAPVHSPCWLQWLRRLVRLASPIRLAAAVAVVAAVIAASLAITRPQPVNAQVIIQKAQAAVTSPAAGGVRSFVLTEVSRYRLINERLDTGGGDAAGEQIISETRRWYRAPDRYRSETEQRALQPDGTEVRRFSLLHLNDGRDVWLYYPDEQRAVVNRPSPGTGVVSPEVSPFGQGVSDLNALLQEASTCYEPTVTGNATVAGRSTYVIDLGATRCLAGPGGTGGRRVIWVDQETFFVLKQELYSVEGERLIWQSEVTSVRYNAPADEALFTFTPPPGTDVLDGRNKALPTLPTSTPAPALPPPTPMPTPTFRVLRPTWLPEPMTVHQEMEGNTFTLGFEPQTDADLQGWLTLRQTPLELTSGDTRPAIGRGIVTNLQVTTDEIGGHTVTVTYAGEGCIIYTWDAAGLRLSLSNVYDLQGQPRYTCEQMRRIVESVR